MPEEWHCEFDTPDGPCPNEPLGELEATGHTKDGVLVIDKEAALCSYHLHLLMTDEKIFADFLTT